MVALGSEICEICEWVVRYGPEGEVSEGAVLEEDDVVNALEAREWPQLSSDNPAREIIRGLWGYSYDSSERVVGDLRRLCCGEHIL